VRYLIVAEANRDLEQFSSRLALTERLAVLADTPADLLSTVCHLSPGLISPGSTSAWPRSSPSARRPTPLASVPRRSLPWCGRSATWARPWSSCRSRLLPERAARRGDLEVAEVVRTLREIAAAEGRTRRAAS
jgi:hypothetical protein